VKRLPLILTIIVIAVLAGGYFAYNRLFHQSHVTPWKLVSAETILVYESSACATCVQKLKESPVLTLIEKVSLHRDTTSSFKILHDFLLASSQPGRLISLHITTKDDFDFVYYVPLTDPQEVQFNQVVAQLEKSLKVNAGQHEYKGVAIHELSIGKTNLSWIKVGNVLVLSYTPVLIEDVIRTQQGEAPNFSEELAAAYQLPRIKNDAGNIFLHLKNFTQWFSLFTSEPPSDLIKLFGQSALLDIKISDDNKFVLNGFSLDSANQSSYALSIFKHQSPVPFQLKSLVSNRAILMTSYGISDGAAFYKDLQTTNRTKTTDSLAQILKDQQINLSSLYKEFKGEIGFCLMESKNEETSEVLLLQSEKGLNGWQSLMNTLSDKLSLDTVFFETYSSYEIRQVPIFRFPEKLFKPLITGFDKCYYTSAGNTLIMSEDIDVLKNFLDDIDKEETWGKSVAQNKYLESTLLESNVSLFVNTPRVWNILSNKLQPRWQKFLEDNRSITNALGMGAIQFSHLNESFYTNVCWSYKPSQHNANGIKTTSERFVTSFSESIHAIYPVTNHTDKAQELLVQDSTKNLSLISSEGKVLWKVPLESYISGDVSQIDFFANGKLQYFFTTPGRIHVVDRTGTYVRPFPIDIGEKEIEYTSIVDYDHSKKYRFLVAGSTGKLWMYDKEGQNLEGWRPRVVDERLFAPPRHYRILGKDYLVAIRDDGFAYLMNRRGELLKNFPVDLNAKPSGNYYLETGSSRSNTTFVIVSREGYRIKFNLEGKVLTREVLVKNDADAKFSLLKEENEKSYLIVRQESKQLTVMDENLNTILTSDFIGNNPVAMRFQDFGAGNTFITITDLSQDLTFVYNRKGNLLTPVPVESHSLVIGLSDDKPFIFYSLGNSLTIRAIQ
jgi:predicted HicB family RNase H-like nuclease